jgi:hypothetical protein
MAANWQGEGLSNMPIFRIRMARDAFATVCWRSEDSLKSDLLAQDLSSLISAPVLMRPALD